ERLPTAAPQYRAAAARLLPPRGPHRDALGVGDDRHDPSPPAQSRGARRPQRPPPLVSSCVALAWSTTLHSLSPSAGPRARVTTSNATFFLAEPPDWMAVSALACLHDCSTPSSHR